MANALSQTLTYLSLVMQTKIVGVPEMCDKKRIGVESPELKAKKNKALLDGIIPSKSPNSEDCLDYTNETQVDNSVKTDAGQK